jgi:hypothetical protein
MLASTGVLVGQAQAASSQDGFSQVAGAQFVSTARGPSLPNVPADSVIMAVPRPLHPKNARRLPPFSRIAIATDTGTLGFGAQIATPIARRLNLRGGFDLANFDYGFTQSGVSHTGTLHLRSGSVRLDLFPFRSGFHISPGLLIFKSSVGGSLSVPGGCSFSMGDATLTSNAANPVTGNEGLLFTRSIMPSLTVGFRNMIAREGRHWSVPLELGAAYTGPYSAQIGLQGSACYKGYCVPAGSAAVQASVVQQQNNLDETMKHYRIFPIVMSGVSYRF